MTHEEQIRQETSYLERAAYEADKRVQRLASELEAAQRERAAARARHRRRLLWNRAAKLRADLEATEAEAARITIKDGYAG